MNGLSLKRTSIVGICISSIVRPSFIVSLLELFLCLTRMSSSFAFCIEEVVAFSMISFRIFTSSG